MAFSGAVSERKPVSHLALAAWIGNVLPDLSRPNNNAKSRSPGRIQEVLCKFFLEVADLKELADGARLTQGTGTEQGSRIIADENLNPRSKSR